MAEVLKEFEKPDFNVDTFTKQLVKDCVGGADLQQRKKDIQGYHELTSSTLKKSVYANYMLFIDTAKEISKLESEMYQLSHILIEQRNILSSLDEKSGNNQQLDAEGNEAPNAPHEDADNKHATRAVKEMVQGYDGNLEDKTFLNEGALIELDPNDYRPIQRVFFFLFNDVLIVCKVKHDKRLEFLCEYNPKKIAVINIKGLEGVKNAINIITPDGSKIFQCVTAAGKAEWIEKFEAAFRFDQLQQQSSKSKSKKGQAPQPPKSKQNSIQSDTKSVDTRSIQSDQSPSESSQNLKISELSNEPEWLTTAYEEAQTLIALRHFEDALALIKRAQEYFKENKSGNSTTRIQSLEESIRKLEKHFNSVLLQELSNCHSRNLQVALRESQRSLMLLAEMGSARQACNTLLKVCTVALRNAQREARRNNANISEIFFCDLTQVACEFLHAFEGRTACVSTLVVWCNAELQYFAGQLIKHYLTKGTPLETVAKCIAGIQKPCAKLTAIGLDLSYHLEGLLYATLDQLIQDSRLRLLDAVKRNEDPWQPYNLQTKSNLKRFLGELDALGMDLRSYATGDTWINLTQSSVLFTRHFLQLTEHCGCLARMEVLTQTLELLLRDLLMAQHAVAPPTGMSVDPNFVMKNKRFLIDDLLPIAIKKFQKISGREGKVLLELQRQLKKQEAPIPKQRSIYQTDMF